MWNNKLACSCSLLNDYVAFFFLLFVIFAIFLVQSSAGKKWEILTSGVGPASLKALWGAKMGWKQQYRRAYILKNETSGPPRLSASLASSYLFFFLPVRTLDDLGWVESVPRSSLTNFRRPALFRDVFYPPFPVRLPPWCPEVCQRLQNDGVRNDRGPRVAALLDQAGL